MTSWPWHQEVRLTDRPSSGSISSARSSHSNARNVAVGLEAKTNGSASMRSLAVSGFCRGIDDEGLSISGRRMSRGQRHGRGCSFARLTLSSGDADAWPCLRVTEGDSPKDWRYSVENLPKCVKPYWVATLVTDAPLRLRNKVSRTAAKRSWRRYLSGGSPMKARKRLVKVRSAIPETETRSAFVIFRPRCRWVACRSWP